jgi:hypothetical protein
MVKDKRINLVCLIETRVKEGNVGNILPSLFPSWSFCFNYEKHGLGRIWVGIN